MDLQVISNILEPYGINIFQDYKINDEALFHYKGSENSIYTAFSVLEAHGIKPFEIRRLYGKDPVYQDSSGEKEIGNFFYEPINEIAYII